MNIPFIKNKRRFGRFALVGGASTAIDFGIYLTLTTFGISAVLASIGSSSLAFIFSFSANKKYTFKTTDTNVAREMALFVIFTLIGLWGFQSVIIHMTLDPLTQLLGNHRALGLIASKLVATGVSMTWNYVTYSRFVFKHND